MTSVGSLTDVFFYRSVAYSISAIAHSDTSPPDEDDDTTEQSDSSLPVVDGALGGAGAYLLGYLLTYLWKAQEYRDAFARIQPLVELFGGETLAPWKIIGWLYYSAHFVESRVAVGPMTTYVDFVVQGEVNLEVLYVVPPLLLLVAGYLVARRTGNSETVANGAQAGVLVMIGYLVLVLVGVFAFQVSGSGPDLVPALLLAGIVYPLVFGGIGGAAASYTGR